MIVNLCREGWNIGLGADSQKERRHQIIKIGMTYQKEINKTMLKFEKPS